MTVLRFLGGICVLVAAALFGALPEVRAAQTGPGSPRPNMMPNATASPQAMKIRVEDNHVTASLREVPLPQVLEELAARTGIIFEIGLHDVTPVSLSLFKVPLGEALQRVAGGNNVLVYFENDAAGKPRISFVRIIARTNKPPLPSLRFIGLGVITKTGDDTVETPEQALKALSESKNLDLRQKAIEVLVSTKGEAALEALNSAASDEAPEIRVAAIEGLAGLGQRAALPRFVHALKDEHPAVRQSALVAIALLGDAANLKDVRPLARDKDPSVVAAAENAIRKLLTRRP